jgi:hypothetical protein
MKIACVSHRLQFQKRRQLLVRTHNETLSVVAMRVSNPDRSPAGIHVATQPQLQPDALSLSATISQYFTQLPRFCYSRGRRIDCVSESRIRAPTGCLVLGVANQRRSKHKDED